MAGHIPTAADVEWNTPEYLLDSCRVVNGGGRIGLDPCSNPTSKVNAVVSYCLPEADGLVERWDVPTSIFVNPPFGRCYMHAETKAMIAAKAYQELPSEEKSKYRVSSVKHWVRRCEVAARHEYQPYVHLLLPAAVDTGHWQEIIFPTADGVCFFDGRLKFVLPGGKTGPAPMACAWVYWGDSVEKFEEEFSKYGKVWVLRPPTKSYMIELRRALTLPIEQDAIDLEAAGAKARIPGVRT